MCVCVCVCVCSNSNTFFQSLPQDEIQRRWNNSLSRVLRHLPQWITIARSVPREKKLYERMQGDTSVLHNYYGPVWRNFGYRNELVVSFFFSNSCCCTFRSIEIMRSFIYLIQESTSKLELSKWMAKGSNCKYGEFGKRH